nr:hypothetical protein [Lactobacillus helveticus]
MKDIENKLAPDSTWQKMFQAAKQVQGFHEISDHMEAGVWPLQYCQNRGRFIPECVLTQPVL